MEAAAFSTAYLQELYLDSNTNVFYNIFSLCIEYFHNVHQLSSLLVQLHTCLFKPSCLVASFSVCLSFFLTPQGI